MKKLLFIAWFIACAHTATTVLSAPIESPAEQLVGIMMSNTKYIAPCTLAQKRGPNDYQNVYDLATKHPQILQGIIHDGQTFAMLCIQRGYTDLLTCLIKEGHPVDLATPCNLCGPHEPQTTILHRLFHSIAVQSRFIKNDPVLKDYLESLKALTKLIIKKCPHLLDTRLDREVTARECARRKGESLFNYNVSHLIKDAQTERFLDACKSYDLTSVQALLETGDVIINRGDEYGCTPLIIAAQKRNLPLLEVLLSIKKSDGSFAANVNQANADDVTPLLAACQNKDCHMVEKLLTVAGIDVNQADNNGETPLLVACKNNSANLSVNIIDLLLNNGAANNKNKNGETPLEITKDTLVHGLLEQHLLEEIHASKYCTPMSKEACREYVKACPTAKEGIAFHK